MNPFKPFSLALLLALGVASSTAAAVEPVMRVPGEPSQSAKAATVVTWRAASTPAAKMSMRDLDLTRIASLQKRNRQENVRVQIGLPRGPEEAVAPLPALRWTKIDGGSVARFEIASPDALGLRVGLKFAAIPPGMELRVAGSLAPDLLQFAGSETVRWQHKTARTYWTPVTDGDRQTIELFVPAGTDSTKIGVQFVELSHLLTNSLERFSLAKAIGGSGSCNVDVVCRIGALGQDFVDAKNAVARMVFTVSGVGTYTCTGTLLADTVTTSQIPYFYTADHCISTDAVAATLNTYWGFEATSCGSNVAATTALRSGGADLLYSEKFDDNDTTGNSTDAALLRLYDTPPANAYFAGWDANPIANNTQVLAIHHPSGDLKKSSIGYKLTQDPNLNTVWWQSGTTEGGSSGSGLFTSSSSGYQLRGGLYGGFASCDNTGAVGNVTPSGPNAGDPNRDYYSRLDAVFDDIDQWLAADSTDPGPTRDYTGAWYVPTESGWGFTAFQYDNTDQVLFVLFFIYDSAGNAKWYEMDGSWSADDVRTGPVMQSNGGQPWSTAFNPALRSFTPVGNATITFTSATTATLNFTVNGVTRNVTVQKL